MDAQPNQGGRRRRRRKKKPQQKAIPVEPVFIAARRPDSPRLEKPTRRMKAASAKPRGIAHSGLTAGVVDPLEGPLGASPEAVEPKKRRQARIIQRVTEEVDERERGRLRLLSRLMASEGRAAITRAVDEYLSHDFELPSEQEVQLKLLEHFDEARARQAMEHLEELIQGEEPRQLPLFRQRLRRLEDYADDAETRDKAAALRRVLPA
jgi:hypothetical protein